jgi:hypothetical protein
VDRQNSALRPDRAAKGFQVIEPDETPVRKAAHGGGRKEQIMSLTSNIKSDQHKSVKASGTVTDLFGHRFIVQTPHGKLLADIGPKAAETITLRQHDHVELEGEQKPTEIKVHRLAIGTGKMRETHHHGPKHDKDHGHHDESFGPMEAAAMARAAGYELIGDPQPHKKHFEAVATKDGRTFDIHVHRDGRVDPKRDLGAGAQR